MAVIEKIEVVIHANGNKTIYHKWEDTLKPKVQIVGFEYKFNSHIVNIEYIQAKK